MADTLFKYFFAILIFCLTSLFGYFAMYFSGKTSLEKKFINKPWLSSAESLAIGIFLGAGSLHLLPDSQNGFERLGYHFPFAFLLAMSCFIFLLGIEQYSSSLKYHYQNFHNKLVIFTALVLCIHSFLEGSAVGVSQEWATTSLIMLAILAHKGAAAFALSMQLIKTEMAKIKKIFSFYIFAIATPLGIVVGVELIGLSHSGITVPIFNALASGTFLYLGCMHGFEKNPLISHCRQPTEFIAMVLGFSLMAVLAIWL